MSEITNYSVPPSGHSQRVPLECESHATSLSHPSHSSSQLDMGLIQPVDMRPTHTSSQLSRLTTHFKNIHTFRASFQTASWAASNSGLYLEGLVFEYRQMYRLRQCFCCIFPKPADKFWDISSCYVQYITNDNKKVWFINPYLANVENMVSF